MAKDVPVVNISGLHQRGPLIEQNENRIKYVTPNSLPKHWINQPEGEWMCLDCQTVKDHTLMAGWIPDLLTKEGRLPTGSCKECVGNKEG